MSFETNVGGADRLLRLVAGAALVLAALTGAVGAWGWIVLAPLATGALRVCPAYTLLGISTGKA